MSHAPEIHIVHDRVRVRQNRKSLVEASLASLLDAIARSTERPPGCGILPRGVRLWMERRDAVGVAVEVSPRARSVRWLSSDSKQAFGRGAKYETYFLSFPYIVLLVVLRGGELTGYQQLYYRRESLDDGEDLLLPNLYNVAEGYHQRCWLCLQYLPRVGELPWPRKIEAIGDHVFSAAFNRSSELNEGNSYWSSGKPVDRRVATPEAWQEATRENPLFTLQVPWRRAGTTVSAELRAMLDHVVAPARVRDSSDLAGLLHSSRRAQEGR